MTLATTGAGIVTVPLTISVQSDGSGDYTTLQAAWDANKTLNNQLIFECEGTFNERFVINDGNSGPTKDAPHIFKAIGTGAVIDGQSGTRSNCVVIDKGISNIKFLGLKKTATDKWTMQGSSSTVFSVIESTGRSSNITFSGVDIVGDSTPGSGVTDGNGIFADADNVTVENCDISGVGNNDLDHCVYTIGDNAIIRNNTLSDCAGAGWRASGSNITCTGNTIEFCNKGVALSNNTASNNTDGVTITGNTFKGIKPLDSETEARVLEIPGADTATMANINFSNNTVDVTDNDDTTVVTKHVIYITRTVTGTNTFTYSLSAEPPIFEDFNTNESWTPQGLSTATLEAWYDAETDWTDTVAGGVSTWYDKSGNENHAVAAAGEEPAIDATGINSAYPSLDFIAANSDNFALTSELAEGTGDWAVALVARFDDLTGQHAIIGGATANNRVYTNNNNVVVFLTSNGTFDAINLSSALSTGTDYIMVLQRNGANYEVYVNGGTADTASVTTTGNHNLGRIGARGSSKANEIDGDLGSMVICSTALGTTERQEVEGWLAHKYGLTGNLPGGHPYKSTPPSY